MYTGNFANSTTSELFYDQNITLDLSKMAPLPQNDDFSCPSFDEIWKTKETSEIKFHFDFQDSLQKGFGSNYNSNCDDIAEFGSYLNDMSASIDVAQGVSPKTSSCSNKNYSSCKLSSTEENSPSLKANSAKSELETAFEQIHTTLTTATLDMNEYVTNLLESAPVDSETNQIEPVTITNQGTSKRMRKSVFQMKTLKKEYSENSTWDKEHMLYVCKLTGLTHYQVYKWYWEQQRRSASPKSSF